MTAEPGINRSPNCGAGEHARCRREHRLAHYLTGCSRCHGRRVKEIATSATRGSPELRPLWSGEDQGAHSEFLAVRRLVKNPKGRSSVSSGLPASVRLRWACPSPRRRPAVRPTVARGVRMRPKSAPPAHIYRRIAGPDPADDEEAATRNPSSCSTKSTRCRRISAATRRPLCSRCSIRNRITCSWIITSTWNTTERSVLHRHANVIHTVRSLAGPHGSDPPLRLHRAEKLEIAKRFLVPSNESLRLEGTNVKFEDPGLLG